MGHPKSLFENGSRLLRGLSFAGRSFAGLSLAGVLLLWAVPLAGQVTYGELHAQAAGEITTGYNGAYGNQQISNHNWNVGGSGTIAGYYYNPNFINFNVLPYYGRSQDNSEAQSISNSSGYVGNVNLFNGTHFPAFISFNQQWNNSGTFGIPGLEGLKTNTNSHGYSLGWNLLLPDLPTLSVGYSSTSSFSSLYGSDSTTDSTSRVFTLGSTYRIAGFFLSGGYNHTNSDSSITGLLENGQADTNNGSSNQYRISGTRGLPVYHSQISFGFNRGTYDDTFTGGQENGTTDNANVNLSIPFSKLPVSAFATYTDNLFGSFEQQLVSSGQAPLQAIISPESHALTMGASTFYQVMPHMLANGFVNHTEEFFAGQNLGQTQFGGNLSYNLLHRLKGLTVGVGMVETADQRGNQRVGFVGNADYRRAIGKWDLESYFRYDQNVQTLLVIYTTSSLNYGATVRRELPHGLRWAAVASGGRSGFEQVSGDESHSESFNTMLMWNRFSMSANYMQSHGTAILTANGLVGTPVPGMSNNLILYNGTSYGGSLRCNPTRNVGITGSYSRSNSDNITSGLPLTAGSTEYYGLFTYRLRKLLFTSGVTNFRQSISTSGLPPTVVTSYYFGISRWFKGF
jgi:hypothetical protein